MNEGFNGDRLSLDASKAEQMIGKLVLVGVTRYGHDGRMQDRQQYAGTVLRINVDEGVVLCDDVDGHERYLPPLLEQYLAAEPGAYRMQSNGTMVLDPDYLVTWDLRVRH
ncbi:hypothetical protein [Stenotrophomonas rhizophila]|uniref:hypothetical protein n=1 Tax=Stenotrophomonas rhizophila TaxID=216778 RepID=UPI001E4314C1|nr:hypothetical protein [Stenotrophomonas rhizophila]MCC7635536.1 hypothetical protein [Stenotrophomonas rhizophila]MCC7664698.1 hypothetical protein [Stenotrophomonas rhizophila]